MTRMSLRIQAKKDVRHVLDQFKSHLKSIGRPMEPLSFGALRAMLKHQMAVLAELST